MAQNVQCKKCVNLRNDWCKLVVDSPDPDMVRDCQYYRGKTNADKYFRNATDEEIAEYLSERSTAPSCTGRCHKDYEVYGELRTFCYDCWLDWLKQEAESDGA